MSVKVAVFNDSSVDRHHGSFSVMSTLDRGLRGEGLDPALYWPVGRDWRPDREALVGERFAALIVNGEGTIHSSRTRPAARWLAELGGFAREVGARCILLNATVHDLEREVIEALRRFDRIYVRESGSQRYLASHGIAATVTPDLSFFSLDGEVEFTGARAGFLVTDSVIARVTAALTLVATDSETPFISMHYGRGFSYRVRRRFERALSLPPRRPARRIATDRGFGTFIHRLAEAQGILTGRFHAATLALRLRTPVLAVESNTPKISYVLYDIFGTTERVVPLARLDDAGFRHAWTTEIGYSPSELSAIDAYLANGIQVRNRMFADLAALARGAG